MKTVKEIREALTTSQRMKRKQVFRKNKAKIQRAIKRNKKRKADAEKLMKRSEKAARKIITKKVLGGKDKGDLSFSQRQSIEKKVDKKKAVIKRLARKLLPKVRKKEIERLKSARKSK